MEIIRYRETSTPTASFIHSLLPSIRSELFSIYSKITHPVRSLPSLITATTASNTTTFKLSSQFILNMAVYRATVLILFVCTFSAMAMSMAMAADSSNSQISLSTDCSTVGSVCANGLQCISGKCIPFSSSTRFLRINIRGRCGLFSKCRHGTICAGPFHARRCVRPMSAGKRCGVDPYWVCSRGLRCKNNICRRAIVPVIPIFPLPGSCDRVRRCTSGRVCAGRRTARRCVTPMSVGQGCGVDPYWVCARGLTCRNNICARGIIPIIPIPPRPGSCGIGRRCRNGQVCAGHHFARRCVTPMTLGKTCGVDPYWVCAKSLTCTRNICRRSIIPVIPIRPLPGSCGLRRRCSRGTVCAGPLTARRCVRPMTLGRRCGIDPYWVCANGLTCRRNICTRAVFPSIPTRPLPGSCGLRPRCRRGTVCAGPLIARRCVRPMSAGKRCGVDPYWVCANGLACLNRICRPAIIPEIPIGPLPGSCGLLRRCPIGEVCAGLPSARRCVTPMTVGKRCGVDPYWVCAHGLRCRGGVCWK